MTLPRDYEDLLTKNTELKLVIMGKDPFPNDPSGIPFCKETWEQQMLHNCSGLHVLQSLGFDLSIARTKFDTPKSFFKWLALPENGIGFLNLSYRFIGGYIRKSKNSSDLLNGWVTNKPILQKAQYVILCGEANKNRWNQPHQQNYTLLYHPDIRNKSNPKTAKKWQEAWQKNKLSKKIEFLIAVRERLNQLQTPPDNPTHPACSAHT